MAEEKTLEQLKADLAAANQLNAELNQQLSKNEKNAGKAVVNIDGKDYEVVTPKFSLDGKQSFEAKELAVNKELAKAVLAIEGQNIVKPAEAAAEAGKGKKK